jgi:hypothetical protein
MMASYSSGVNVFVVFVARSYGISSGGGLFRSIYNLGFLALNPYLCPFEDEPLQISFSAEFFEICISCMSGSSYICGI